MAASPVTCFCVCSFLIAALVTNEGNRKRVANAQSRSKNRDFYITLKPKEDIPSKKKCTRKKDHAISVAKEEVCLGFGSG